MIIGVTGANGQLGCSLRKIAADYPQHRFVFSDLPQTDITDKEGVSRWVELHRIELIVNCAAYTAVDKAESEPDAAWKINALGPAVLGEICAEKLVKLIHISTDYVFDGRAEEPYKEDHPTHPIGVYGATKQQGEQAVRESGCEGLIIRTSWLYSEFGHNFVKTMLRLGREKDPLRVVDDQVGSPTFATSLAKAVMQLTGIAFDKVEVYHYCDDGATSWYDFARMIFILSGNPVPVIPVESKDYPTPAGRPAYSVLDTDKIRKKGVRIPFWADALKECLNILKNE